MKKNQVDEYLQKGLHGPRQTKPEERRKFLGTLRERIIVALTINQVKEKGIYPEVEQLMKEHPQASLLINGNLDYFYISDYLRCAQNNCISFSIVTNMDHHTDIGLVLAYDYAINKEEIYITKKEHEVEKSTSDKKSFFSKMKKLFTDP